MPDKGTRSRLAVGLMSGTSMDGIDAALVRISGPAEEPRISLLAFLTAPYHWRFQKRLLSIAGGASTTVGELSRLNRLLGDLFAEAALQVCQKGRVAPRELFVVGSHGQTIFHYGGFQGKEKNGETWGVDVTSLPELGDTIWDGDYPDFGYLREGSTLQIAEPAVIAELIGAPVVADFRAADIAAGGQGAPLVPMVDYLLLRDEQEGTIGLNIGGIANVTVIPANAQPEDVFGFDTGPGNMIIDALVRHFTDGRNHYDEDGRMAGSGKVLDSVLTEAMDFPFFSAAPPKSAGREQFGAGFVEKYFLGAEGAKFEDLVRTATELTARSIADAVERCVSSEIKIHRLIVSGGGAHNAFLMDRLRQLHPELRVDLSDKYGVSVDAKEAMAFALLADRTMHGLPGNLPRVTGARRSVVLGKIVNP